MVLLRALSRGSRVLCGPRFLILSSSKNLQTPSFSTQFHSFVHSSPIKFVTNDASLFRHSSTYFIGFQRFGTCSSASPDPLDPSSEAEVSLKVDMDKLVNEMLEFARAEDLAFTRIKRNSPTVAEIVKAVVHHSDISLGLETLRNMDELASEIQELEKAKVELIVEMIHKVYGTLENVMATTGFEVENFKKLYIQSFVMSLTRASTHVEVSFPEIDKTKDIASLHKELELARNHLFHTKSKSKELGFPLHIKSVQLRNKLELLRKFRKTESMSDADILQADMDKLLVEILKFVKEEEREMARINLKVPTMAEIVKAVIQSDFEYGLLISMDMFKLELEMQELRKAKLKLYVEMIYKVFGPLVNVMFRTKFEVSFVKGLRRASSNVKGSFAEINRSKDTASLHEQLELARRHFSDTESKSAELGIRLQIKSAVLRKKLRYLQECKKTGDDRDFLVYGSIIMALCIIWLLVIY